MFLTRGHMRDNLQFWLQPFMLIAFSKCKKDTVFSMTDSMNFGPDWIRNLSSEGNTGGGGSSGGTRYQLADYRYGREEMLALFDRNIKPPACLTNFKSLYSETTLPPLALTPSSEDERGGVVGGWQVRPTSLVGAPRGRGSSLERGRISRGRGGYQAYGRPTNYEGGWGNGEPSDWSPRKEYNSRPTSMDNWRRARNNEEDDGWRNVSSGRGLHEKWGRSTSWRGDGEGEERTGPPERGGRSSWQDGSRGAPLKRSWDNEDHLPEWANENPLETGGSFDDRGAFHGSDDEQLEGKGGTKREGLQKSTSQQHITNKAHPPLLSSKSTMSLVKDSEDENKREMFGDVVNDRLKNSEVQSKENSGPDKERKLSVPEITEKSTKEAVSNKERAKSEGPPKSVESLPPSVKRDNKVEDNDFERLQEDFVLKLVVDEELPQQSQAHNYELPILPPPPPNLTAPGQDKWFYQDPQGQMQGPFTNIEMSEWFKAGYFGQDLKVRRQCDERFFLLGELMTMCGGSNPFQTSIRFPVLKNDISKMPETDLLQFQYLSQMAAYKQAQARVLADPWSALTVQQQELAAQRLIMQQQQVQQDLQYMQQPPTNPLMHMISQMQQANKLPGPGLLDKHPPNMPGAMDPHMHMHMTNFLSMQNRLPGGIPNHIPAGIPGGVSGSLPPEGLSSNMSGLQPAVLGTPRMPLPGMPGGLGGGMGMNVPRPSSVDQMNSGQDHDPISSLLKQLQQQKQQNQVESLWQQNQYGAPNSVPPQQWPGPVPEVPLSMWDIQQSSQSPGPAQPQIPQPPHTEPQPSEKGTPKKMEKEKENRLKEDIKEQKKKKEAEEKQQKKDAEERRKQEQRKIEAEKKLEAERKRKEEDRIRKELEKVRKEAEDKRLRELEEKRRLKEQRKLEEEAKKQAEDTKKVEEDRMQKERETREREEKQRAEERRQEQISMAKAAPWCQANSGLGLSLTEIQKAEKERKAQDAVLLQQRALLREKELQLQQQQQQQQQSGGIQMGWAKRPMEPRKVKSLAEIQAEEQERLAKEAAEARLRKERESREAPQLQTASSIWSGQNLTWANASTHSQWSSSTSISGFWEETPQKPTKPSTVSKSSSMSVINNSSSKQAQQQKPQKTKPKREEASPSMKKNHNNNIDDDFTNWCYKALTNISTNNVDIPTFITFLRDIESAFEVREYCKVYLGEGNTTQQFANNFLEKRRSFKPKNAHKDDMCSPAPAITPSLQHSMEFQEVKGKNKKTKKSKMLKVDSRILGFNVTSAPDRINVGDRDYGDNS